MPRPTAAFIAWGLRAQAWELAGLADQQISEIAARPGSSIYAVTLYGDLFVSQDGGDSWSSVGDFGHVSAVTVDPGAPSIAYAGTWEWRPLEDDRLGPELAVREAS